MFTASASCASGRLRPFIEPFRQGLKDLGYVEGQNLTIEFGLAKNAEQLPEVADALVRRNVDLIVASGAAAVLPARDAARGVPVIFIAGIDPITLGLASKGLAQGGANITGLTTVQIDLTAKRMQLLKEMLPSLTSVAFLLREANPRYRLVRCGGREGRSDPRHEPSLDANAQRQ